MYSIILLEEAKKEWIESAVYYEIEKKGLGEKFSALIEVTLQQIAKNPKLFQKKKSHYREALLKPFPFVILFRIDKSIDAVVITGIFHTKRNPKNKINRE